MPLMVNVEDAHDEDGKTYRGCLIFMTSNISFFKKVDLSRSSCVAPINGQANDSL